MTALVYYVLVYLAANLGVFAVISIVEQRSNKVEIDDYNGPVSYTHLDVYKRQVHHTPDYLLDVMEGSVHKETDVYFHRTQRSSHCIVYSPEKDEVVALFLDLSLIHISERSKRFPKMLTSFRNIS